MTDENVPQHATHTLGEILADNETFDEKAKKAAKKAPFLVIAIMVHVIIGAIMGMMYFAQQKKGEGSDLIQMSDRRDEQTKLEDLNPKDEEKKPELTAIPEVENTDITEVTEEFNTVVDDTVNPYAATSEKFGMSEGTDDAQDNLLTMSSGGKGLAGAIGVGSGSGAGGGIRKGSPLGGSRIGRRNSQKGQLAQTEKAVQAGLEWLKRHQSPDGSWDPSGYVGQCDSKLGTRCEGRGSSAHIGGLTGLALLCFLGCGYDSNQPGPYQETVRNGLKWLRQNQDAEGCFGPRSDHRFTYDHACATIAMCEAYASTKQQAWKKPAQMALDFAAACQNPYGAWRYGKQPGDNDSSVTGWMIMALKSGKDAGLTISDRAMKEGIAFVDSLTDKETGRTGYTKPGEHPVRPEGGAANTWPATESEALTAVSMCSRIFAGVQQEQMGIMKLGQELLEKRLPVWDEAKGSIDMYYWYYGTLAMFQMGGPAWDRWNQKLKPVVVDHQCKDGCTAGSWDTKDPWCDDGGRVYSTSLMTLCLEVYYRFPKVFGTGKK